MDRFYKRVRATAGTEPNPIAVEDLVDGVYPEQIALLGRRTAELHLALAASVDPRFEPEPFTMSSQRSLDQSMQNTTRCSIEMLRTRLPELPEELRQRAGKLIEKEPEILEIQSRVAKQRIEAANIRVHGDYHLGQVLSTGKDFVIIDFEGEPARPLSERRVKKSPLKDVAGMLRSFHYAAHSALLSSGAASPEELRALQTWAELWSEFASERYLISYLDTLGSSCLLPVAREPLQILLDAFLLEKAAYELAYELNNRPAWLFIPMKGIEHLLSGKSIHPC